MRRWLNQMLWCLFLELILCHFSLQMDDEKDERGICGDAANDDRKAAGSDYCEWRHWHVSKVCHLLCWDWVGGGHKNGFVCSSVLPYVLTSVHPFVHHSFMITMHFQTNHSGDWSQTWWIHSSWYSTELINFLITLCWILIISWPLICQAVSEKAFPGLWLVEQFLHIICQQTDTRIELKFYEISLIDYRPPPAWLTLLCFAEFQPRSPTPKSPSSITSVSDHLDILHRTWQYHSQAMCKISKIFDN